MLIVQNMIPTAEIPITASGGVIAAALTQAAQQIPPGTAECSAFTVTVKRISATDLQLIVRFDVDNAFPLTLLQVYDSSLQGR